MLAGSFNAVPDKLGEVNPLAVAGLFHALDLFVHHAGVEGINYNNFDFWLFGADIDHQVSNFRYIPADTVILLFSVVLLPPSLPCQSFTVAVDVICSVGIKRSHGCCFATAALSHNAY